MALVSIDPKALEHACLCAGRSVHHFDRMGDDLPLRASIVAHARAIERFEATEARHAAEMREQAERFEAFRQEVSDELAKLGCWPDTVNLQRFILPKPDPLEDVWNDMGLPNEQFRQNFNAALAARGLEIRNKQP